MSDNAAIINKFYTAFSQRDYKTMQDCYADNAVFNDAVFKDLNALQVRAMWEMLLKNGKDLSIHFHSVQAFDNQGSAQWEATYTFSRTGNNVLNIITAHFEFENGKIVKHTDNFNFYTWASQAFGLTGKLLGWTQFFRNKVQATAAKSLSDFMLKKVF